MNRILSLSFATLLLRPLTAVEDTSEILRRQTQELFDAIPSGSASVWERYLDEHASYTDENGTVLSKKQMVEQMRPFPKEITGNIKVTDFRVTLHGSIAITTHVEDEHETYYGHELHCQYRTTDTWLKTSAGWRLLASQVLALRTDPPSVPLTTQEIEDYVGSYMLTPTKTYEIRVRDGTLEGQDTGHAPEVLRSEAPDMLFVPGKPRYRKVFLRDAGGRVTGFAERREAWDLVWKRLP